MDTVWAPVVAVVVTFAGSALIPWMRDALDRRSRAKLGAERAFDAAVKKLLLAAVSLNSEPESTEALQAAAARLYLLVPPTSDAAFTLLGIAEGKEPVSAAWEAREVIRELRISRR